MGGKLQVLPSNLVFSPLKEGATLLAYTSALAALELGVVEHFLRAGAPPTWNKLDSLVQPTSPWVLCDEVGTRNGRDGLGAALLAFSQVRLGTSRMPIRHIVKLNALADIGRQKQAHRPRVRLIAGLYAPNPIEI